MNRLPWRKRFSAGDSGWCLRANRWAEGVELTYRKLMNFLEADGVSQIIAEGQFFDPTLHEAISQEDLAGYESGQIIGVVQQGYRLGDRILRPARVRVAR